MVGGTSPRAERVTGTRSPRRLHRGRGGKRGSSNYVKGRAREYRVKKRLYEEGALWVVRSYGSHGLFDLTAVFPDCVRLIQVKKDYLHPKEKKALKDFAGKVKAGNISVEVWFTSPRPRVVRLTAKAAPGAW